MIAVLVDADHKVRAALLNDLTPFLHVRHLFPAVRFGIKSRVRLPRHNDLHIILFQVRFQPLRHSQVDIFLQAPVDSNLAGICSAVSGIDHHHRCLFYVGVTAPRHTNTPIFHRHDHHGEQAYAENRLYYFLLHALFPRKSALHNTLFHREPVYVRIFLSPFNPKKVLDSGFRSYRHHQLNPHISLSVFRFFHTLSCIDTSICHLYNRVRQHERSGF